MRLKALKAAFPSTLPIFTGFWFLGMAYGIYGKGRCSSPSQEELSAICCLSICYDLTFLSYNHRAISTFLPQNATPYFVISIIPLSLISVS